VTGKQEVIGIEEFLTPLDPKLRGGFPNRSREKEHSVRCRMIVNFSQNITSKSLKISHPIFDFTKEVRQITPLDRSWNQRPNWHHFDGCTRMKTNMLRGSPVAQR
jgi:hypothetical protein